MSMSTDTRWDLYQAKDKGPFWGPPSPAPIGSGQDSRRSGWRPKRRRRMGAGGERGMGAGGVYVKYPDGSMHWDETRADPSDSGGSVIDSTTGKVIPGADRQSGSTGPGGTGAPGSQARTAHAEELQKNPSFASDTGPGSMLALGANNLQMGPDTVGSALMPGALGKSSYTPGTPGPGLTVAQTTGSVNADPALRKMKEDYDEFQRKTWKVGSSLGKVGSGGDQGMGAGGVYVKAPDGSMHWDETKADPNPNGGSVIDTSGKVVPGANRQSGSTGPGGTGAPGTQARDLHVAELQANPSFASDTGPGSMLVAGANNLMGADTVGSALASGFAPPTPGSDKVGLMSTDPSATTIQTDPELKKMKEDYDAFQRKTWKVGSSLGKVGSGGEGGMGAGDTVTLTPSQQASIDLTNKQLDNLFKVSQMEDAQRRDAENNRHNEALAKIQQDYQFHQDDVLLKQAEIAENSRHNQAQEQLSRDQMAHETQIEQMREAHEVQIQQMQEGNAIYLQQGQQAFEAWGKGQDQRMQILGSALSNPWMQQLVGMSPGPGASPGSVVGGRNIANLVQQIMRPYDPSGYGVQNAPSIMGLAGSTGGGPGGGGGGGLPSFYDQSSAGMTGTPSWEQWQQLSPWQKAAYRADQEALGPGVWNQMSAALGQQFYDQGGTQNVTKMQAAGADPAGQAGMQMTGELFGQSAPQFWQGQQKMWSGAQAANVKSNLGGQQNQGIAS